MTGTDETPAAHAPLRHRFAKPLPGQPGLRYIDLVSFGEAHGLSVERLPKSIRILLESLLRKGGDEDASLAILLEVAQGKAGSGSVRELPFFASRVVLQDAAGIPLLADLAAMRTEAARRGLDPAKIEPRLPVDMVIDHSVSADAHEGADPLASNMRIEFRRNDERYRFLKWACQAFARLRVIPPGIGILHQVNLEYLSSGVLVEDGLAYPDSVIGTDSHTVMINGIGVLGWGVGGIEAIAALLGEPTSVPLREVVAVSLEGAVRAGVGATDLVLHVTQRLRSENLVGCFVEFVGPGARAMSACDRSTIANMAPEYGATTAYFAVDDRTLDYLRMTGRSEQAIALVRDYGHAQRLFGIADATAADYARTIVIDLGAVTLSVAGPKRPQDRVDLADIGESFRNEFGAAIADRRLQLADGSIVLAAITSCTNTSNPTLMVAAGLVARNAIARGLRLPAHVKATLAPGSRVVTRYLQRAGLLEPLERLGFRLVAYGCTTCVGNSGELLPAVAAWLATASPPIVASVLSGNRNFEGRIHPQVRANYLMSPALVVGMALAGSVDLDPDRDPIGIDGQGRPVFLRELWPAPGEIESTLNGALDPADYRACYRDLDRAVPAWSDLRGDVGPTFRWPAESQYFREPPFLARARSRDFPSHLEGRILLALGESVTTDHISPVGRIGAESSAALYLRSVGVAPAEMNTFGARRCNHEVMVRGTFAHPGLVNRLLGGRNGPLARGPDGAIAPVYDVAMNNIAGGLANFVFAADQYGTGSARDWAAKGTALLGVAAVVAVGFERIHRANLVGMGVLPLQMRSAVPDELVATATLVEMEVERASSKARIRLKDMSGSVIWHGTAVVRVDSRSEWAYLDAGGLLPYVFGRVMVSAGQSNGATPLIGVSAEGKGPP